mmetsp:Transcript_64013/g.187291  ORF Transcript_64013/g.187291 Transcript_64013/m.187291 type:complete len:285 (+) Transcript_64013:282-1136(+)
MAPLPLLLRTVLAHVLATDHHRGVVLEEVWCLNPEDTIFGRLIVKCLLDLRMDAPKITLVTPVTLPLAGTPRVPQLQQVPARASDVACHGQDSVGVALDNTKLVLVGVTASMRAAAHEVVLCIILCHELQDLSPLSTRTPSSAIWPRPVHHLIGFAVRIGRLVLRLHTDPLLGLGLMELNEIPAARQHAQGEDRVAAADVLVGARELRDGLLSDAGPDFIIGSKPCEGGVAVLALWYAVVHNHRLDSVGGIVEKADSVLPILGQGFRVHDLPERLGEFCYGRKG